MPSFASKSLFRSVKGKVLIGFLLAGIALGASWIISKLAFETVLTKLEVLSTPNDKLRLVNKVFKNILQLDHLQNASTASNEEKKDEFLVKSQELSATLDTLSLLSLDDPLQIIRIDSMKRILEERERIFESYVKVRSKLVSNQDLSDEVKNISGLITTKKKRADSTIVKTEKKTTTTISYAEVPAAAANTPDTKDKKGFFGRVFSSKKNKKEAAPVSPTIVSKQEVNVEVDTLKIIPQDTVISIVGDAVHAIEKSQKKRTSSFVDREQELSKASSLLVGQLLRVMQDVENEVVKQSDKDNMQTQKMVAGSIDRIEWVMLGFFFITALLAYLIFTDITRSNQYRSELEEAKEEAEYHGMAKQRFLSNMSHEIRTPLQSIIGYTEVLKKDEKPKKEDLNNLQTASEHLLYLVNDVLDYSRIISDKFTFEERTFALTPLLTEVVQMLRPTTDKKNLLLSLKNEIPADLLLKGDPFRIRQILYNLLTNAVKFTHEGEIGLEASSIETANGVQIQLKVNDTGIGLSHDHVQRIFNQFEQADPSITRRYGGTGLGLSIVKSLVEAMNGTIQVLSELGKGTSFSINIVLPKADAPLKVLENTPQKTYQVEGTVWLVDDDAFILKWCSSVLDMHKIKHQCFSSAEEVLDHPWDDEVRFVLTDMRMQGMTGAELCNQLRARGTQHVKYYVLTAQALPEERSVMLNMGFDGILMKPFHANQLMELLEKSSAPKPTKQPKSTVSLDFSALEQMTFGDEAILREILELFTQDSRKDLSTLQKLLDNDQIQDMHEIMHRMAGRSGQIGAKDISAQFRQYEVAIRDGKKEIAPTEIEAIITKASLVIDQVEEKIHSYSI